MGLTILVTMKPGVALYFVHSNVTASDRAEDRLANSDYHGPITSAAVWSGNVAGSLFHPEVGLRLI